MEQAVWLTVGFLIGCAVAVVVYDHAFRSTARWQKIGRPDKPTATKAVMTDRAVTGQGMSPESQAAERALERVIERGADEFMQASPRLTREEARAKARAALDSVGSGLGSL